MSLLEDVPVVDAHCHGWRNETLLERDVGEFFGRVTMLGMCLAASDAPPAGAQTALAEATATAPIAVVMASRLAALLGESGGPASIAHAREAALRADPGGYLERLWRDANVIGLLVDDGYPQPRVDPAELSKSARVPVHSVARIEPWIVELRDRVADYAELEEGVVEAAESALRAGAVAFKSVIAYRTGLDVRDWDRPERVAAFRRWRESGWLETREDAKPVRDGLLLRVLALAGPKGFPVHIHSGAGDPDVLLEHARPAGLLELLRTHASQPVVLIHAGWPWTAEAAYLASVLPNVYVETSVATPWATLAIDSRLELLLGIAPPARVLYGSDEASEPEVIWLSASLARESLERVLSTGIERGYLNPTTAQRIGTDVLARNTARLHRLEPL